MLRRVCDLCGQVSRFGEEVRPLQLRRYGVMLRRWIPLDAHKSCVLAVMRAKLENEKKQRDEV